MGDGQEAVRAPCESEPGRTPELIWVSLRIGTRPGPETSPSSWGRSSVYRPFHQLRKTTTGIALGVWLFALFVGVVHACGWVEPSMVPAPAFAADAGQRCPDEGTSGGCAQFCKLDIPVVTKLPPLGEHPDAQPLIVAVDSVHVVLASPSAFPLARGAHSSSEVPPFLRFTRLRL